MLKLRTLLIITSILLLLGMALYPFLQRSRNPMQVFPATVNRDCAPWDGSAFTVQIPWQADAVIYISIWKSPEIKFPVTFSFPDNTGQVGNASYRLASDEYQQLSGTVFFWRVEEGNKVTGTLKLAAETGQRFEGQFEAEWGNLVMMCG